MARGRVLRRLAPAPLAVAVVALLAIVPAAAQPGVCSTYTTCFECFTVPATCKWAMRGHDTMPSCYPIDEPNSTAVPKSTCTCAELRYCTQCEEFADTCAFCGDTGKCVPTSQSRRECGTGSTTVGPRCSAYCRQWRDCEACQSLGGNDNTPRAGCAWFDGFCYDVRTTSEPVRLQECPEFSPVITTEAPRKRTLGASSFDAGSFVGGIILGLGVIAIAYFGFRVYTANTSNTQYRAI